MANETKRSVLIIDDNDVSRSMLRFIVSSDKRYDVIGEAASGALGLEVMERSRVDIVCLDINMPDQNGLEILKKIKIAWPRTLVLMVTGSNDRETVLEATNCGADGYIVKPFHPGTLLRTVEQALGKPVI